ILGSLCAGLIAGCGNYSFKEALGPDGKYDLKKLRADLKDEKAGLTQGSWLPLVHLRFRSFEKESQPLERRAGLAEDRYPPGYSLDELDGYGPLFSFLRKRESRYDAQGEGFEVRERRILLWHLWQQERSLVKTPYGTRLETRNQFLHGLLGGEPVVRYSALEDGDRPPGG
ncbi:MAG: hypothetical protein ACRD2T_06215, partial [Thermoanaerobaculia bacterium]